MTDRIRQARRRINSALIAVEPHLSTPYPDAPNLTPWTRFVAPALKELTEALDAVQPPAPAATDLRERVLKIAKRLEAHAKGFGDVLEDVDSEPWGRLVGADIDELRDAVTALPAPADRPAVLREAANGLAALGPLDSLVSAPAAWTEAIETLRRMADQIAEDDLRRMADDAQQAGHIYLSTSCLHGEHGYCAGGTGQAGAKTPAQCKFCAAPCICPCHAADEAPAPAVRVAGYLERSLNRLYCPADRGQAGGDPIPVTADDLPDGGHCHRCGRDLLIPAGEGR
ncbi:hypothetical protein [Streptomyces sp. KL116D]|uniref:hypothetical protein n=1 Tax=Streptomyces sp. KL116D TaxID=3045152 RepID=UPI003556983D